MDTKDTLEAWETCVREADGPGQCITDVPALNVLSDVKAKLDIEFHHAGGQMPPQPRGEPQRFVLGEHGAMTSIFALRAIGAAATSRTDLAPVGSTFNPVENIVQHIGLQTRALHALNRPILVE